MSSTLTLFGDGGSRGNPGEAAYGFAVFQNEKKIYEEGRRIGIATNNVAEYTAVIKALEWVLRHYTNNAESLEFFLDSMLVVNQMNGKFKIKNENLRDLVYSAKVLIRKIDKPVSFTAIPREKNTAADRMVNLALDNLI